MLPLVTLVTNNAYILLIDSFYRAGALVFGGGHVVLPLLQTEFVDTSMLDVSIFLAGYGMTQLYLALYLHLPRLLERHYMA